MINENSDNQGSEDMAAEPSIITVKAFDDYVEKAKHKLHEVKQRELPLNEFRSFCERSKGNVISQVRQALLEPRLRIRFRNLSRWLLPPAADILDRVGISELEDKYTKLIIWMLSPPGRPDLALRIQRSWFRALKIPFANSIEKPAQAEDQVITQAGRPDIVMRYRRPEHTVIIEAKINTPEHDTPEKSPQTISYPPSIKRHLGLPSDHEITMVFLTADNLIAKNEEAISTSYELLLNSIASELSPEELPFNLRAPYSMIITHIFAYATLRSVEQSVRLEAVQHFLTDDPNSLSDETILREVGILGPFIRMVVEGD